MIKKEQYCDDSARYHGQKDPLHRQFPESHEENASIGRGRSKRSGNRQGFFIESGEFANIRHSNEENDGDSCGVFGQEEPNISMEQWFPRICGRQRHGEQKSTDSANDRVKERGEGDGSSVTFQLLYGFVKIDD